jgi:hypothetical protein
MRRLRLLILVSGLLAIAILLILPEVDPLDAAGAEATSATLIVRWQVPTPVVRKTSGSSHYSVANDNVEILLDSVEFTSPDLHPSLTL